MPASASPSNNANGINLVPVSSIMIRDVKTAREGQTILDVCKLMHQHNIGSIVIVRKEAEKPSSSAEGKEHSLDKPVGIITERDIVRHIATKLIAIQAPVEDVMSRPLVTVRLETSLADAIQIMQSKNFRRLIVVDNNGKIMGIITDKDIFRAIARKPTLISGFLSEQAFPSLSAGNKDLIDQLRMESLDELFRPRHG
jgi:CBS domain-containing protein